MLHKKMFIEGGKILRPKIPVERPVLNRLANMLRQDRFSVSEVGDGSRRIADQSDACASDRKAYDGLSMNRHIYRYIISVFMLIALTACSDYHSRLPGINLRDSESNIRSSLLKLTPIGTSYDQVVKILLRAETGDKTLHVSVSSKDAKEHRDFPVWEVGRYHDSLAWVTQIVHAVWIFDSKNNLKDIKVTKDLMGL